MRTLTEIIDEMRDPATTTGERCALVAEILEDHPEHHDQHQWGRGLDDDDPEGGFEWDDALRLWDDAPECGTACCVAGWAVVGSPTGTVRYLDSIPALAVELLGISDALAATLFACCNQRPQLIKALRWLADVEEDKRTLAALDGDFRAECGIDCAPTEWLALPSEHLSHLIWDEEEAS